MMVSQILTVYWKTMSADRFKVNNIINFGQKYIYDDTNPNSEYHTLCQEMIVKLVQNTIIIIILILVSYAMVGCHALYVIIIDGKRITFMGTEIPFVDSDTTTGFIINIIVQLFLTWVVIISNITIEIGVCLVHNAFEMIPRLIRFDSDELNIELDLNGMSFDARMRLRNILIKVQDFNR